MRSIPLLVVLAAAIGAAASQVIAAVDDSDQSDVPTSTQTVAADANQSDSNSVAPGEAASQPADADEIELTWFDALQLFLAGLSLWLITRLGGWRLAAAPRRSELFSPAIALTMVLMIFVLGRVAVMVVSERLGISLPTPEQPREFTLEELAKLTAGVYLAQLLIVALYLYRSLTVRVPVPDQRANLPRAVGLGIVAMVLAWPIVATVGGVAGLIVGLFRVDMPGRIAHQTLELLASGSIDRWHIAMGAMVVLATPIIEEVMYRGLLQQTIVNVGLRRWPAIVITSVFFALMHIDSAQPHAVLALFVLSLGLGLVYERTGRLLAPIVMHALFNAANLALGLTT